MHKKSKVRIILEEKLPVILEKTNQITVNGLKIEGIVINNISKPPAGRIRRYSLVKNAVNSIMRTKASPESFIFEISLFILILFFCS